MFCENCGEVPVNEEDLPVKLPEFVDFTGKGKSPLASNEEFINTACPKCAGPATREVDTMDTFVDSSWYFLRYINPKLDSEPWQIELANKWLPVDQYVGGAEHAVLHLLYARFITKVLYDLKYINFDEPFKRLIHQGIITNRGAKMSKSKHNVVNPDNFINKFGSDTFRMFMMFMGSYEDGGDWNDEGISGVFRFLNRIDRLIDDFSENPPNGDETLVFEEVEKKRHYTIKTVTQDLDRFQFNTAISRLMEFFNSIHKYRNSVDHSNQNKSGLATAIETLITLLAPFAPHLSEELWSKTGRNPSIFNQTWPEYDENKLKVKTVNMVVQVNGKLRGQLTVETGLEESKIIEEALQVEKVKKYTTDKRIIKSIVIPQKLVNFVTN